VLVLSQHVEQLYAKELLSAGTGGLGYLLKDRVSDVVRFIEAVHTVARGGTAMDPEVVSQLLARRDRDEQMGRLTPREREVLALMGVHSRGLSATRPRALVVELLVRVEHAFGSCLMTLGQAVGRATWSQGCGLSSGRKTSRSRR
jgi:hypothetical protein